MGQYHKIVNTDKKEYLNPHTFDDGAKLMEFGLSGHGTMTALAVLLAVHNNRGGGDCRSNDPLIGSWGNDRIVIVGDYGDEEDDTCRSLYAELGEDSDYTDISEKVIKVLQEAGEDIRNDL